jgi:transaldolase
MAQNEKLTELSEAGVAVWLDDLSRDRIRSGNLQSLVDEYSVVGVTTNPTIFAAAISGSDSYNDQVHAMAVRKVSVEEALRTITAADVRDACDLLAPVAQRTGRDGRVSLEVSPGVAPSAAHADARSWIPDGSFSRGKVTAAMILPYGAGRIPICRESPVSSRVVGNLR